MIFRRRISRWFLPTVTGLLLSGPGFADSANTEGDQAALLRERVREWIGVRREIRATQVRREEQANALAQEIRVLERRKADLEELLERRRKRAEQHEAETAAARAEHDAAMARRDALESPIRDAEIRIAAAIPTLPPGSHEIDPPPAPGPNADFGRRVLAVLDRLGRLQEADTQVRAAPVLIPARNAGGAAIEADGLFLGLSTAFAVTPDNTRAFAAVRGADGMWSWHTVPEHADAIRLAIRCRTREHPAALVPLPLRIPQPEGER